MLYKINQRITPRFLPNARIIMLIITVGLLLCLDNGTLVIAQMQPLIFILKRSRY